MVPGIMLERRKTFDALDRSRRIVRGEAGSLGDQTWNVLGVVVLTFVITNLVPGVILLAVFHLHASNARIVIGAIIATLTAPYSAHVLTVLYYRLTDPARPVIDPVVRTWPSVWKGPA
jgi:hypothetical protein